MNQSTAGRLTGIVADTSAAADPIGDAQVWVMQDSLISHTFTDTLDGAYQLIGLTAGSYTASATAAGYDTVTVAEVVITAATATPLDFELTPLPQ
ncbi:carboxypeptidase-like regulatory domain-containing protein [Candidatus Neomarinimicrobiota bacterium]